MDFGATKCQMKTVGALKLMFVLSCPYLYCIVVRKPVYIILSATRENGTIMQTFFLLQPAFDKLIHYRLLHICYYFKSVHMAPDMLELEKQSELQSTGQLRVGSALRIPVMMAN